MLSAKGIDASAEDICFELDEPLVFEMRSKYKGQEYRQTANLVWMNSLDQGQSRLGFRFVASDLKPELSSRE